MQGLSQGYQLEDDDEVSQPKFYEGASLKNNENVNSTNISKRVSEFDKENNDLARLYNLSSVTNGLPVKMQEQMRENEGYSGNGVGGHSDD